MKIRGSSQYGSSAQPEQQVKAGIYKHFKGDEYEVYGVFTHRDNGEQIVAYSGLNNDKMLEWRLLGEFTETINRVEYSGPRFVFVRDLNPCG